MRVIAALAGVALLATVGGCVTHKQTTTAEAPSPAQVARLPVDVFTLPGQVEPVHAAVIARDQAIFWVTSNGCTAKSDLQPVVAVAAGGSVITLRRIKEDRCQRPQPDGVEVRWSFEELGLAPGARLTVQNPAQITTSVG